MPKATKPTQEQVNRLLNLLIKINQRIAVMIFYHNKRVSFFRVWDFLLNIINAVFGVGVLFLIGWQLAGQNYSISSAKNSLLLAAIAIFLLFLGKLLDFSKKEENHRWLATIYMGYNKELSDKNLIIWNNLIAEDYRKWKDLHDRIKEGVYSLRKAEYPLLEFEHYLCDLKTEITVETKGTIFLQVNWWQHFRANYFSMENTKARFVAQYNYQARQQQQQQERQKQQKDTP